MEKFPSTTHQLNEAIAEKEKGNQAYKHKNFSIALEHYNKAIELDPTNLTFLTNKAAVYFEQKDFENCRKLCFEAIDVGRANKADYPLIAKAYARIANSYLKQNDLVSAMKYFNKALSEHRTRDIVEKLHHCQKAIAEQEKLAYINPELAIKEKEKGNQLFKSGKYPEALKCYDEAIRRDPDCATLYSNRAACYMKLAEFRLALKDCDECIAKDPTFIKGHVRKGAALEALKEYSKAVDAYQKALDLDPKHEDAALGTRRCINNDYQALNNPEEVKKRAMADPEVGRILSDPVMSSILQQMENNPSALAEHLKNPEVARNIQKLIQVGVIGLR